MLADVASAFDVTIERQPWCDEIHLTDPDGTRLRIGCPNDEVDTGYSATPTAE